MGLIPTYRAAWAKVGNRPTASSRRKYDWRYSFSFVHPTSGDSFHIVGNTVNTEVMSQVLRAFAQEVGAGSHRQIVLVLDGAGWHTSKKLVVPEGIHLQFLPPYSPELQPAERLFPLINEAIANRWHRSIEQLEATLDERVLYLQSNPVLVSANTLFHWWPDDIEPESFAVASK